MSEHTYHVGKQKSSKWAFEIAMYAHTHYFELDGILNKELL